jgi:hypothetical protein
MHLDPHGMYKVNHEIFTLIVTVQIVSSFTFTIAHIDNVAKPICLYSAIICFEHFYLPSSPMCIERDIPIQH